MGIEGRLPRFLINKKGTLEGLPLSLGPKFRHVANKDLVLDRPIFELGPEDLKAAFSGKGPTSEAGNSPHSCPGGGQSLPSVRLGVRRQPFFGGERKMRTGIQAVRLR
jgi:hypothetical protein